MPALRYNILFLTLLFSLLRCFLDIGIKRKRSYWKKVINIDNKGRKGFKVLEPDKRKERKENKENN